VLVTRFLAHTGQTVAKGEPLVLLTPAGPRNVASLVHSTVGRQSEHPRR
jgi:hypothetical protein